MDEIIFILYVSNQERSKSFYSAVLNKNPVLDVPGMTEFILTPGCKLGLMPVENIARIICPAMTNPSKGQNIPRCELYLLVPDLTQAMQCAINHGAILLNDAQKRDWGHVAGYVADPDGHIIAFASHQQI